MTSLSGGRSMKLSEQLQRAHESGDYGQGLEGWPEQAQDLEAEIDRLRELVQWLQSTMHARVFRPGSVSAPPQQAQQILLSNAADDSAVLKRVQEQWAIERAQRCCIPATGEAKP